MSTLAILSILVPCSHQCGHAVRLPAGSEAEPVCERCRKSDALGAVNTTLRDVRDLIAGNAPFDVLSVEERSQQMHEIIGALEGCGPLLFPRLKIMDDQSIIGIVSDSKCPPKLLHEATAELARRISAPSASERDEIEQRCIVMDGDFQDAERWDCCT